MNILEAVEIRNIEVRRGLVLFVSGAIAFVLAVDLTYFVWLGGVRFATTGNLKVIAWMLGILLATSLFSLWRLARDGRIIASEIGAIPVTQFGSKAAGTRKDKAVKQLDNILDELCIAAACPKPSLYVLPSADDINAFACGMEPEHWCITVTEGAMRSLKRDELQALVAHELAHLTSGDTRNGLLICAYVSGLSLTVLVALLIAGAARGAGRNGAAFIFLGLMTALAGALGVFIGQLLEAFLSRRQEFRADAEAVRLTRHGDGMVSLLTRLAEDFVGQRSSNWDDIQRMGFSRRSLLFSHAARTRWFDSHPPLVERIRVFDPAAAEAVHAMLTSKA